MQEWEHRFEPHLPVFVSVARGRMRLFLSEHTRDARPDTLLYLRIDDVDQVAEQFGLSLDDTRWARGGAPRSRRQPLAAENAEVVAVLGVRR